MFSMSDKVDSDDVGGLVGACDYKKRLLVWLGKPN